MSSRHNLWNQNKVDLRFRKASPAMFKSLSCQRLFRQSFTHGYPTHLPIVGSQTSLKLQPFRHNMSIALRATREDGSGMQQLDLLLRILLIPQWRTFRRRISIDILGIAGCTCAATWFLVMCADQSDTMKHIIYRRDISNSTYRSLSMWGSMCDLRSSSRAFMSNQWLVAPGTGSSSLKKPFNRSGSGYMW